VVFIWGLCFRIALTWQTSKIALPHSHQDTFKSLLEPDLHTHTHTRACACTHTCTHADSMSIYTGRHPTSEKGTSLVILKPLS